MNMNGFVRNEVFFMRDYKSEFEKRVKFIKSVIAESGAKGIVYGNSGGKDSALVGILCKAACDNTIGLILPCTSKRNYNEDTDDAKAVAAKYNIETRIIDLDSVKEAELKVLADAVIMNEIRCSLQRHDAEIHGHEAEKPHRPVLAHAHMESRVVIGCQHQRHIGQQIIAVVLQLGIGAPVLVTGNHPQGKIHAQGRI